VRVRSALFCDVIRRVLVFVDVSAQPIGPIFKTIPIDCPETSINNYQSTPYNLPEERRFLGCPIVSVYSNLLLRVERSQHDPSNFCLFTFRHGIPSQKTCVCSHTDLRTSDLATFLHLGSSFLYYEMCRLHASWKFVQRIGLPSIGLQV
jgi:hypothetical protein